MSFQANNGSDCLQDEQTRPEPAADWCTKPEIAAHFRISIRTVTTLMQRRILPFVKVGNLVRFSRRDCDAAMLRFKRKSLYE